ncbi:porin family protein [Vibrio sp.]|nr:porin family protein [Vibrio sp.]
MRYIFVLFLMTAYTNVAFGADDRGFFYRSSSLSTIASQPHLNDSEQLNSSIGYNWKVLPNLGFDIGYIETINHSGTAENPENYHGMFGAALIQQRLKHYATVYAKGGLNWIQEKNGSNAPVSFSMIDSEQSTITPFLSIGANIPSPIQRNLELNVELSYQNLQLDEPDTIFLMGAKYRF